MEYVKPIREKLVVDILNRFLQANDVSFHRNLLLDSTVCSTPRSWIPVVDDQALFFRTDERFGTLLSK